MSEKKKRYTQDELDLYYDWYGRRRSQWDEIGFGCYKERKHTG